VCKLGFLLSVLCCSLSKHWYGFRVTRASSSGEGSLSELVKGQINYKCRIVIYHFMLQDRIRLGSN
jgi:hypothetical protein